MTHLNDDEQSGFNFAVQLYTQLLFEQKELINGIIETAYSQGIKQGVAFANQQIIAAQQEAYENEHPEESPEESEEDSEYVDPELVEGTNHVEGSLAKSVPVEQPKARPVRPPEKFSDKLKGVRR